MPQLTIDTDKAPEIGLGSNLRAILQGTTLILIIDTTQDLGPSSSGKMRGVASTGGFQGLPGGLKGNIYVGKKVEGN